MNSFWGQALLWLAETFTPYCPPHARRAAVALRHRHPGWKVVDTRTRARESDRFVVAVFYEELGSISFPTQYLLYAVPRDGGEPTELPTDPDSPYWIRGRK